MQRLAAFSPEGYVGVQMLSGRAVNKPLEPMTPCCPQTPWVALWPFPAPDPPEHNSVRMMDVQESWLHTVTFDFSAFKSLAVMGSCRSWPATWPRTEVCETQRTRPHNRWLQSCTHLKRVILRFRKLRNDVMLFLTENGMQLEQCVIRFVTVVQIRISFGCCYCHNHAFWPSLGARKKYGLQLIRGFPIYSWNMFLASLKICAQC